MGGDIPGPGKAGSSERLPLAIWPLSGPQFPGLCSGDNVGTAGNRLGELGVQPWVVEARPLSPPCPARPASCIPALIYGGQRRAPTLEGGRERGRETGRQGRKKEGKRGKEGGGVATESLERPTLWLRRDGGLVNRAERELEIQAQPQPSVPFTEN